MGHGVRLRSEGEEDKAMDYCFVFYCIGAFLWIEIEALDYGLWKKSLFSNKIFFYTHYLILNQYFFCH